MLFGWEPCISAPKIFMRPIFLLPCVPVDSAREKQFQGDKANQVKSIAQKKGMKRSITRSRCTRWEIRQSNKLYDG